MEGAITAWGNTRPVDPARSRSTWSIWEPPTSIDDTKVSTFLPGFAPPTRPPSRTVPSTKSSNPRRSTNVPATNNPASATKDSSSKTTSRRSILCDTPLTGSASRLQAKIVSSTVIVPDQRHFPRLSTPQPPTFHRWIQGKQLTNEKHMSTIGRDLLRRSLGRTTFGPPSLASA